MADITITPLDNGPYIVKGGATLVDAEGKEFETKETIALCRCGQSSSKPFCDGTHSKVSFQDRARAG